MDMSGQPHDLAALPQGTRPCYPLNMRLDGRTAVEDVLVKKVLVSAGNRTLHRAAHSLISISAVLH
jgi:hypothetical protein